ncbi:MAG: hypothetical protein KC486_15690 [Myxococcales bacterium]|nr:hypothetical protein [Myxococcales bacterium]
MTRRLASACLTTLFLTACNGDDTATSATDSDTTTGGETTGSTTDVDPTATTGTPSAGPTRYFLRIDDEPVPDVVLEMDKEKALEVFGEAAARDLVLIDVDSTVMLENALRAIQFSCGGAWENFSANPKHDCAKTTLGQTYGDNWQESPEYALVRMLTMTPINAVVTGTSLESLANFINDNKDLLAVTFPELLAESLGIAQNQAFIKLTDLSVAIQQTLLASHPAVGNTEGKLSITLWDAANDMQPLSEKLGPMGDHPGILIADDADFQTKSDALTADFKMKVVAESNLRWVDGIDLSVGGGDMFVTDAASPLSFDFLNPQKLVIEGVADKPTIDMRLQMTELDGLIDPCVDDPECRTNYPADWTDAMGNPVGEPVGDGTIWTHKPWLMEYVVARAALIAFAEHYYERCLLPNGTKTSCYTGIWIGPATKPAQLAPPAPPPALPNGWSRFKALDEPVPPPQFLWELLLEVAQVAIHDPTGDGPGGHQIAEGDAAPVFALTGIWIGLTAEEMIAQIRPKMQEQADKVANVILGKYWKNNKRLDFYYRRPAEGGTPYLYFVAESDLRPAADDPESLAAYAYANPGFFACPELTQTCKVSATSVDGLADTAHEKYRLPAGDSTLYAADDDGVVYQIDFFVPPGDNPTEIVATVNAL